MEEFVHKWSSSGLDVDHSVFQSWNDDISAVARDVKNYAFKLRAKKRLFLPGTSDRSLVVAEASLKLQELTFKERQEVRAEQAQEKADEASILSETEGNLVLGECNVLADMLVDVTEWSEVEDEVVGNAMRNMARWQ